MPWLKLANEIQRKYSAARPRLNSARRPHWPDTLSELLVERVLDEVVEHPKGLVRGGGVVFGDALHHRLFLGEGMQPAAEVEHLPVDAGAVELSLERVAVGLRRHRILGAVDDEHRGF